MIFPRKASGHADGAHDGLCSGIYHTDHLHMGNPLADEFSHLHLFCSCTAKAQTIFTGFDHCLTNSRMVVSQDHRSPGPDIIRVGIAVHIEYFTSHCTLYKARGLPNGTVSPYGAVHPSGNPFYGALK